MRVFLPATVGILRQFVADKEFQPAGGTGFALTPALREVYVSEDEEELEFAAMREAERASLRLLAGSDPDQADVKEPFRRVVIAVDVGNAKPRPDLDAGVVKLSGPVPWTSVAAVHVDTEEADDAVRAAVDVIDAADLGDPDADFVLGEAEDHQLAWYAPQEVPFFLELL